MMPTNAEYLRFLPEIILTLAGVLIMFLEAVLPSGQTQSELFAPLSHRQPRRRAVRRRHRRRRTPRSTTC